MKSLLGFTPWTSRRLELHHVRAVAVAQGEAGGEVALEVCAQGRQQGGVQGLLVGHVLGCQLLLLGTTLRAWEEEQGGKEGRV